MSVVSTSSGIGARATRVRDVALLSGSATFVADLGLPGMVHARVVRSPCRTRSCGEST